MNYNLIFWFFAYGLTGIAIALALFGWIKASRGELNAHRKLMNAACSVIVFFVVSYLVKVIALGREDKSGWELFYLIVLYIHEALILTMLVCGGRAWFLSLKFGADLYDQVKAKTLAKQRSQHKLMGKIAIYASCLAMTTASVVLYGMYMRNN